MNKIMNVDEALKAYGKLHILHAKQTVKLRKLIEIQQKQIEECHRYLLVLSKQVNHLRINLVVRPDKIIKIPEMKK